MASSSTVCCLLRLGRARIDGEVREGSDAGSAEAQESSDWRDRPGRLSASRMLGERGRNAT